MKATWVLCVLAPLAVVAVRAWMEGERDLAEAARLGDRSDEVARTQRVAALGRAARRLGGPAGRAREALAALGRRGELPAFRELRGSILATRHLLTPAPALLDEADRALADALADELVQRGAITGAERASRRELEYQRLRHSDEPARLFALLALAGVALFLSGAAMLLLRGSRPARWLRTAGGLALCLLGLWRA